MLLCSEFDYGCWNVAKVEIFIICFIFMLYIQVLFAIYFIFMLNVLLHIYYLFICILYVFLILLCVFLFSNYLILNLWGNVFTFVICRKLLKPLLQQKYLYWFELLICSKRYQNHMVFTRHSAGKIWSSICIQYIALLCQINAVRLIGLVFYTVLSVRYIW